MRYDDAPDLQFRMEEIANVLNMNHIELDRVKCIRSFGSSTRNTLARCHTIGKVMQKAIGIKAHYAIEFLEIFEKLSREEQDKVIIHELMHIPKTFGGGFRQHNIVCDRNVNMMHDKYLNLKKNKDKVSRYGYLGRYFNKG